ncbi:MAG: class I SAM-dependent methyltransferase [Actinobacteria bacterium]|nr:class I SAM-dependent methyltransferase [Actinomycetota bacterium]
MTLTSSASFRDPENAAFSLNGDWFRIAGPGSAEALSDLRTSQVYTDLVAEGALVTFDEVTGSVASAVLSAFEATSGRTLADGSRVFAAETVDLITYPWEWPNSLLEAAALLTLDIRERLLGIGLDLKDASAFNVQFRGMRPVFIDLGSVERWRPNPSWNASRQFIEHFINPLAVGSGDRVTAAEAWDLGKHRGLRSDVARSILPSGRRRSLSLLLLQSTTRPVEKNAPAESKFSKEANRNKDLARNATVSLTRRLAKQVVKLRGRAHSTTWVDYGTRDHYGSDDLTRKSAFATEFLAAGEGRNRLVLDVGGNDGFTAAHLVRHAEACVVVMDADAGALDVLQAGVAKTADVAEKVTPVLGDITNLTPASGLLDREFAAFTARMRPSAVICQAVLHHVVITQGAPMQFAVDALAAFGAPLQVEFATEEDEKARLLLSQIPNWSGEYSTEALLAALRHRYANVEVMGTSSPTRVVVNAWDVLDA